MAAITVETTIAAPIERVWTFYTDPAHIIAWNSPSDDWHTPKAINDLKVGGVFNVRMEAKDGSQGFDFRGTYDEVVLHKVIRYSMDDGRRVSVAFDDSSGSTHISVTFEPETQNPIEVQRGGWQAILDNFKSYVQTH